MRVYFGVCGLGLGHVGRCIPVAKSLLNRGGQVLFSTYGDALVYLAHEGISFVEAPLLQYDVKQDGEVDFRKTTVFPGAFALPIFLSQVNTEIMYIRAFKPDIVVSDSRASTIIAARLLGLPVLTILNLYRVKIPREKRFLSLAKLADGGILTVVGRLWSMSDEILIPDFPEPYTLSVGNLGIPPWRRYKVRLVGPVLRLKASELPCKEELREKLGLQDGPVIFVPISGPQQEKEYFARKIQEILLKMPAEYRIVISLANPERDGVQVKVGNVTIHSWLHNWCEYLKACDMLICRSGLGTISQAICFGKPLLTVPTPSHTEQQNNAFRAEELGVAKVLDQRKLTFESVLSGIREVLYSGYIERAEKLRREVERYDGEQAILDAIIRRAE